MRRPALLLLFALAALAPMTAMASEWYRCRTMGVAQPTCCCPKTAQEDEPASDLPTVKAAACCDLELAEAPPTDPRSVTSATSFAIAAPCAVERVAFAPQRDEADAEIAATPRQSQGPPALYLQHCSLLL